MLQSVIQNAHAYGAQEAEVFLQETAVSSVKFEDSRLKSTDSSQSCGIAVRVLADKKLGFGCAADLAKIRFVVQGAVEAAWQSDVTDLSFPSSPPPTIQAELEDEAVRKLKLDHMARDAGKAIQTIREYDPEILAFGGIGKADVHIRILNTAGFDSEYRKTLLSASVGGQLVDGTNILFCYRESAGTSASIDFARMTEQVIADFDVSRVNVDIEGGAKTVIFTPRAAVALFEVLKLGVNGRNVEKATSPIRDRMGKQVLSEKMTIVEDGLLENGVGSAPFDDEGTVLKKRAIVEKGVLKSFAVDLRTARKLNLPPTGNGFRVNRYSGEQSYESPPSPQNTNWLLLPGEPSYDEILADIQDGVIVDLMMGLFTGNLLSGDFSANLMLAYKISKGRIVGRIKDAMVSGNFYDIFRDNVLAMSRETERVAEGSTTNIFPHICAEKVMISA
jgi:PmbA protein